jgi:hypothetical protein
VACQQQVSISTFNDVALALRRGDDDCIANYGSKTIDLRTQLNLDSFSLLECDCSFGLIRGEWGVWCDKGRWRDRGRVGDAWELLVRKLA